MKKPIRFSKNPLDSGGLDDVLANIISELHPFFVCQAKGNYKCIFRGDGIYQILSEVLNSDQWEKGLFAKTRNVNCMFEFFE
ncbi:hypothetical protein RhiirC2_777842 [Rhizophagus irregularis]|uniref:Uncharacterized protein n=1 Tax=Rhizophagus irregularis TaxID=588596 RepID=A0A2N1NDD5_9GLOM|nr:hypothetical protein RhiirC2_777842 [Rhizophagus irregularis]